jgi:crossover junction endodeoxyribonuclease RusA
MIRLELPYPISANRYWKQFVNPKTGLVQQGPSHEAKVYKREVAWIATQARVKPIVGYVLLRIFLTPHCPLDAAARAKQAPNLWALSVESIDLGNCEKVLSDALNGIAWEDDRQLERIELERTEPGVKGCVVEIEPYMPRWLRQKALFEERAA